MLPEEEWSSSKEDLQVSESELKVSTSVLTMFIVPSMIVIEWERNSTWALHVVDQQQVKPKVQGKNSESTSRAADQEFDC